MVAVGAMARASMPAVEPPACGERAHDMFVGAPGEGLGNPFDFRTGTIRNLLGDFDVGPGGPYPKQCQRQPSRDKKAAPPTPFMGLPGLRFDVAGEGTPIRENPHPARSFRWSGSHCRAHDGNDRPAYAS